MVATYKVGQTVVLQDGQKATIRFVGETHFKEGDWIGVELETKAGKNDGSVQNVRYFDCKPNYGLFLKPTQVKQIVSQPPVAKPAPKAPVAKKPAARPTSFNARVGTTGSDPTAIKRQSLNAPSPSPGPKLSRPSSIARVSYHELFVRKVQRD